MWKEPFNFSQKNSIIDQCNTSGLMLHDIITGIVYVRYDEVKGTTPLAWFPENITERKRMLLGIKSISLLTGEGGFIPEDLVYIPVPSISSKCIIKYSKWEEKTRRGGFGTSSFILLYPERYDAIYYKYRDALNVFLDDISETLIKLEKSSANKKEFSKELQQFYHSFLSLMENLKAQEEQKVGKEKRFDKQDLLIIKTIVVGDAKVGKTSIVLRFTDHTFTQKYLPTIGVNITQKDLKVEDVQLRFMLWDIAGQDKFKNFRKHFFAGAQSIIFAFDLTQPASFERLEIPIYYREFQLPKNIIEDSQKH
ncbi:MAG: Rab family GTPase [Promethearchaeia archaeon]